MAICKVQILTRIYLKVNIMRKTICPYCGKIMYDDNDSIRFRCQFCKEPIDGWQKALRERLEESLPEHILNVRRDSLKSNG